jgi:tetratricopeptide (TPR) repeat protein
MRGWAAFARAAFAAAAFGAFGAFGACAKSSPEASNRACPCEEGDSKPVDQLLLAWLSKARTLHHLADLAEDEGAIDKAIAPLDELVGGALPRGQPPEVAEVMADTYARLADLRTRRGDYARADQDIASGLKFAPAPTYFRGHLLEVRGLVHQKESDELAKAGKASEAKAAREKALAASVEAVRIQNEVIKSTLGDAGPATRD